MGIFNVSDIIISITISVNCFALISGNFGHDSNQNSPAAMAEAGSSRQVGISIDDDNDKDGSMSDSDMSMDCSEGLETRVLLSPQLSSQTSSMAARQQPDSISPEDLVYKMRGIFVSIRRFSFVIILYNIVFFLLMGLIFDDR